jgi:hypothetical protein
MICTLKNEKKKLDEDLDNKKSHMQLQKRLLKRSEQKKKKIDSSASASGSANFGKLRDIFSCLPWW